MALDLSVLQQRVYQVNGLQITIGTIVLAAIVIYLIRRAK